eukprot:gene6398-6893_t
MSITAPVYATHNLLKSTSNKGLIKIPVKELNELLTCYLCRGYYQQANTIPDCLHTFCRVCIVRYVLEHSTSSNIRCPKCDTDLGTYSQITKKVKYDRNLQAICDALFPSQAEKQREETLDEDKKVVVNSKRAENSEPMEVEGVVEDVVEEGEEDVGDALSEVTSSSKKKDTPSATTKISNPSETSKKVSSLPQKSLQNILGHKLLATELLFKSADNPPADSGKKRKNESEDRAQLKQSTEKSEDESMGRVKRAKAVSSDVEGSNDLFNQKKSPSRAQINPPASETTKPEITAIDLSTASADKTAKSSSQGKDFLIKLAPDDSDASLKLPPLPKPNFHSGLKVQVTKIQSFIFTRFPEDLKQKMSATDIDVFYEGKSILNLPDLTHLTPSVQEKVVQLSYRRLS